MDPRRGLQHEYGRSRGGDGGGYGAHPSSSGRAIPPTAVPSLSTGQGFYTVESLQGATMVPPPQPAPPPPRLLPPLEPYARDLPPHRLHPAERRELGPFDRRYPPPPAVARKMMVMLPPDMPLLRRGGPGVLHHLSPPFMGDPRMRGFPPDRRDSRSGWGPGDFERHTFDRNRDRDRDRARPSLVKRLKAKKQVQKTDKPVSQAKSLSNSVGADKKSSTDKRNTVYGGPGWCALCKIDCCNTDSLQTHLVGKRHKKQLESQTLVDKAGDKTEEDKVEGGAMVTASGEAVGKTIINKDNEQGETVASQEGGMDLESTEAMAVEASKGEDNTTEPKPIAGKKRVLKDAVKPKKKPRKSAASDTPNSVPATAVKGSEGVTTAIEVLAEKPVPDTEGADHASKESSVSLKLEGDVIEPPTSDKEPVEESVNEGMDGENEVSNTTDLENGRAGQSAKIQ